MTTSAPSTGSAGGAFTPNRPNLDVNLEGISGIQGDDTLFAMFGLGGPDREWMTVTMYLYELGWNSQRNLGRSAAVAWLLFLIIVAFALINYAITRRISSGDVRPMRKALVK